MLVKKGKDVLSMSEVQNEYYNVADIFGENVFNDTVMQERLPKKTYKKLREVIEEGKNVLSKNNIEDNVFKLVNSVIEKDDKMYKYFQDLHHLPLILVNNHQYFLIQSLNIRF